MVRIVKHADYNAADSYAKRSKLLLFQDA